MKSSRLSRVSFYAFVGSIVVGISCGDNYGVPDAAFTDGPGNPAALTIDVTSNPFGSVTIDATSPAATFVVSNTGGESTGVVAATLQGSGAGSFQIASNGCTAALAPATSCSIEVTFAPTTAGAQTASLAVAAAPGGTVMASLEGTGVTPGALTISASTNALGSVVVGATGTTIATFTVTNTGGTPTGALVIQASGADPAEFVKSNDLCAGAPLAAAATCTFEVAFAPRSAGAKSAVFEVGGTPGGVVDGAVTGLGLAPAQLVTAFSHHDFGSVVAGQTGAPLSIVFANSGDVATSPLTLTASGDTASFPVTGTCLGATVAPGMTCTAIVAFAPPIVGAHAGRLTVAGAPQGGTAVVTFDGTGVAANQLAIAPSTHAFANTLVTQTSAAQTFTITNTAAVASGTLLTSVGGADPAEFAIVTDGCNGASLTAAGTCTIAVTFAPTTGGPSTARLVVASATGGTVFAGLSGLGLAPARLGIAPATKDFGSVAMGAITAPQSFTITNLGGQPSGSPTVALGGAQAAQFTITGTSCTAVLAAGESCTVMVRYDATTLGTSAASLDVTATPGGTVTATLAGETVAPGQLAIVPATFSFPTTLLGETATQIFTVRNTGAATTGAIAVSTTGDYATTTDCTTLAAQATCSITVTFAPTATGARVASLHATAAPGGTASAGLAGIGRARLEIVALDGDPAVALFDFGPRIINNTTPDDVLITVRNNTAAAAPLAIVTSFGSPDQYATLGTSCGGTIDGSGGLCVVRVRFQPTTIGAQPGSLTFSIGTGAANEATQDLTGTGIESLVITALDGTSFGAVPRNTTSIPYGFRVSNPAGSTTTGAIATTLTGDGFQIASNGCTQPLVGGGSCLVTLTFAPLTTVAVTGVFTASASPGGAPSITVTGSGVDPVGAVPTDITLTPSSVPENSPAGTAVGTLATIDADATDTFSYALIPGGADNGSFAITGDQLRTSAAFDFETKNSFAIRVRTTDSGGQQFDEIVVVTVTNVDEPPVAVGDDVTVAEDSLATTLGVLANDTDVDGGPKTVASVTQPLHGTVAIIGGGTDVTYTPEADFNGTDSFTYTLNGGSIATVGVTVTAVDDRPIAVVDTATVVEDAPATTIDVLANDTDIDGGTKLVTAVVQPTKGSVVITAGGGSVTYQPNLDQTGVDTFTYTLNGGTTALVMVTITPVDDAPVAVADAVTLVEDAPVTPLAVLANDTDVDNDPITIASITPPANGTAAIAGTTIAYQPNADFTGTDTLTYTVNGGSTAIVTITVAAVDDAPVATADAITVLEDTAATGIAVLANDTDSDGGTLAIATATDPDHGTVVLTGGTPGLHTGLTYQPDANHCATVDTFTYTVNGGSTATVTVTITCVDDAPTAIALSNASLVEDAVVDIGTFTTTDVDPGDTFTHTLVTGAGSTDNAAFTITGGATLRNTTAFNFEDTHGPTYAIRVRTTDGDGLTFEQAFTITVTGSNEAPTDIALSNATIAESVGPSNIGTFTTTDPDAGDTAVHTLVGGTGSTDNALFAIAGASTLRNIGAFDFEATHGPSYSIRVRTTDAAGLTFEKVFAITVTNDNEAPTDIALSNATIAENVAASTIGTFTTTDPDTGNTFTHALIAGTGGTDNALFTITGGTTLRNVAAFDFEATHGPTYSIRVRTTDGGGLTFDEVFAITVTNVNEAPTDLALSNATIAENVAASDIGTFTTSDPDTGNTFTYALITGAGSTDNALFAITGANLRNVAAFDFEAPHAPTYSIRVRTTDGGGLTYDEVVAITVTNANEAPTDIALSNATIVENVGASNIGTFTTTDPDTGDTATHTLIAGTGDTDNARFAIAGGATLRNVGPFDFEAVHGPTYSIRVRTTDLGGATFDEVFTITVTNTNEAPTDITLSNASIAEGVGASDIGTFAAIDLDAGDTAVHTLVGGAGSTDNALFAIAGGTTLRNLAAFDFEAVHGPTYSIRVRTTDGTGLTFDKVFVITVTNVNEAPTDITLSNATIAENVGATTIGTFTTTDPDTGNTFTHTLVAGTGSTDNALFAIAGGSTLQNVAAFDFEAVHGPAYSIRVRTTDTGGATFEEVFTITVTNANEAPTDIALSNATIAENLGASNIGTFTTSDVDATDTATHTLVAGAGSTDNALFAIVGGTLRNLGAFDFEAVHGPTYSIRVRTTDLGGATFDEVFAITVTNVNEAPVADPETFDAFGNTELRVGLAAVTTPHVVATGSVLTGDADPDGETIAIAGVVGCADGTAPFVCTLAGGSALSLDAAGTFSFTPGPGIAAAAATSFSYTIIDVGGLTATGVVTIQTFEKVWYVKGGPTNGNGTSASPFNAFTPIAGAFGVGDLDAPGDYIFVHDSMVTTGIELEANQHLIGEGVGLALPRTLNPNVPGTTTLVAAGIKPNVFNATGEAVKIMAAMPIEIRGLTLGGGTNAIDLSASSALNGSSTLTIADNAFNGAGALAGADDDDVDINVNTTATGTLALAIERCTWGGVVSAHAGNGLGIANSAIGSSAVTLNLNLSSNTIKVGLDAISVVDSNSAAGVTTITGFANNTISGETLGSGVRMTNVTFDAVAGGAIQQVNANVLRVGTSSDFVGGSGMVLATVGGSVRFDDLDLYANAAGLSVTGGLALDVTPAAPAGAGSSVVHAQSGAAISIIGSAIDLRLQELFSTGSTGNGVALGTSSGQFAVSSGAITNANLADVSISGGSVAVTYGGTITDDVGSLVSIAGSSGQALFTNAITDNGNATPGSGVTLTSNTGLIRFSGGLVLSTGANPAFAASGGGTVEICDENPCNPAATGSLINTIATTTGVALSVTGNTTIGANKLELQRVDANGALNGINLGATGTLGGLVVTGTGAAGSGGTIQNTTGSAIVLSSTANVELRSMNLTNSNEDGIEGATVTNLLLTDCQITGSGDDSEDVGIGIDNLLGAATFTNLTVTGSELANVMIHNDTGTLAAFTITGGTYGSLGTASGANSILVETTGTAALTTGLVTGATITNNKPARGITVQAQGASSIGNATTAFTVQSSTFTNNGLHASFEQSGTANLTFKLMNTTTPMTMPNTPTGTSHAVNVASSGLSTGGTLRGRITGNVIGNAAVAGSGSPYGNALRVLIGGKTQATLLVDGNIIRQVSRARGIEVVDLSPSDGSAAPTSDVTITNNSVLPGDVTGAPLAAIYAGADSQGGAVTLRTDIRGNTVPTGTATGEVSGGFLVLDESGAAAVTQLFDTAPASASCTAELTSVNTGTATAAAGCALITTPLITPP